MHIKTVIFFFTQNTWQFNTTEIQGNPQLRMEQDSLEMQGRISQKCSNSKSGKQRHIISTQAKSQLMPLLSQQLFYFIADGINAVKLLPFGMDNSVQIKTEQGVDKRDARHTQQL